MNDTSKKPIKLVSPAKYFKADHTKCRLTVSSPDTQTSRNIKQEGYQARLYWQFRYCQENDGQTFFYTLTYNDSAIPTYLGRNCFDYEDLRDMFTGGFRKMLLRKYGTIFKYFVGAELGEGAGKRGMENNPHYHVLFFLEDAKNPEYPYEKITPEAFRSLVKLYWQGFDETENGEFFDYRTAKYGIAKEGDYCGLVQDFRAISYVSKYVTKDVGLKKFERNVLDFWSQYLSTDINLQRKLREDFFHSYIMEQYNKPSEELLDLPNEYEDDLVLCESQLVRQLIGDLESYDYYYTVPRIVDELGIQSDFASFEASYMKDVLKVKLNEFRNRYCNKCRISNGVGDYALKHMDKNDPKVTVPDKKGFKTRPLSLYYYRKLFTDYFVDENGSVIRHLNDDGIDYKLSKLKDRLKKSVESARVALELVEHNEVLYNRIYNSDINTDVRISYTDFLDRLSLLPREEVLYRFAEFKNIYEGRYYRTVATKPNSNRKRIPVINPLADYEYFLIPSVWLGASNGSVSQFIAKTPEIYNPYESHPYFLRYHRLFAVIDLVSDYLAIQKDNKLEEDEVLHRAVARYHKKGELKTYYANFSL